MDDKDQVELAEWQQRAEKAEAELEKVTAEAYGDRACALKAEAELVEWRKCSTDSNVTRINILAGRIALTRDDALHIAGAQDYDAVTAQNIAYRKALEDILDAARDPWGNSQHTIAGICNEALGNGNP